MAVPWRLISGSPRSGSEVMAVDAALLARGRSPALHLWNVSAPAILVGAHEAAGEPGSVRRSTGGGTFVVGPPAAGWSVLLTDVDDPADAVDRVACTVATAMAKFGVGADFRGPDLIEADGKRIGWAGGASLGKNVLVQGAISEPPEEFGLALMEVLAEIFEAEIAEGDVTAEERPGAAPAEPQALSGGVTGELPTAGGKVRATLVPGDAPKRIAQTRFTGNFNAYPGDTVRLLGAALAGTLIDDAPGLIEDFFAKNAGRVAGVEPGEFLTALSLAHMKVRLTASTAPDPNAWKRGPS